MEKKFHLYSQVVTFFCGTRLVCSCFLELLRYIFLCALLRCAFHCGEFLRSVVGRRGALLRSIVGRRCLVLLLLWDPVSFHGQGVG